MLQTECSRTKRALAIDPIPPPKAPADLANLIAVSELAGPAGAPQRLLSDEDFSRFIANAENPEREGVPDSGTRRIQLPDIVKKIDAWFVAGIRIDPGASGLSADVITQFGRQPQIRLIIQPVTNGPEGLKVHDTAGHLIFSFNLEPDHLLMVVRHSRDLNLTIKPSRQSFMTSHPCLISLRWESSAMSRSRLPVT
ncbi:hypothetical protein [Bradyrhizobium ottawaense]|uniref:hypothetical protein n=1 Tax=Bradyrhizobium ottawaense TaxID=931866 RepID=UPI0030F44425